MTFQRRLWTKSTIDASTRLPCPHCHVGSVRLQLNSLTQRKSTWLKSELNSGWNPLLDEGVFTCYLVCDRTVCGEVVAVAGDTAVEQVPAGDESEWIDNFFPRSMVPAPPLLTEIARVPRAIKTQLKRAFSLFWSDYGSAANALRVAVERLMDAYEIKQLQSLAQRIKQFEAKFPEHSSILVALKEIGNTGSHEGEVDRNGLLHAFELFDYVLDELYSGKKTRIASLTDQLRKSGGRPNKFPIKPAP